MALDIMAAPGTGRHEEETYVMFLSFSTADFAEHRKKGLPKLRDLPPVAGGESGNQETAFLCGTRYFGGRRIQ